jgi:hypothetical protein
VGEHTAEILLELGLSDAEITNLHRRNIVAMPADGDAATTAPSTRSVM